LTPVLSLENGKKHVVFAIFGTFKAQILLGYVNQGLWKRHDTLFTPALRGCAAQAGFGLMGKGFQAAMA
jgi:hypothetical protein